MVHHTHQHVFVVCNAEKPCPQRDLGRQIKRVTRRLLDGLSQPACRPSAGINDIPAEVGLFGRNDQLLRYALGCRDERTQALMTVHHIGHRRAERVGIELATHPQRHRHVVNR